MGNETATFSDGLGNEVMIRRYQGNLLARANESVLTSANCSGLPLCNTAMIDTFTVEYDQTAQIIYEVQIEPNSTGTATFQLINFDQGSTLIDVNTDSLFIGTVFLNSGVYIMKATAKNVGTSSGEEDLFSSGSISYKSIISSNFANHYIL